MSKITEFWWLAKHCSCSTKKGRNSPETDPELPNLSRDLNLSWNWDRHTLARRCFLHTIYVWYIPGYMLFHSTCMCGIAKWTTSFFQRTAVKRCCIQVLFSIRLCSRQIGTRLVKTPGFGQGIPWYNSPVLSSRNILALGRGVAYRYVLKIPQRFEETSDAAPDLQSDT